MDSRWPRISKNPAAPTNHNFDKDWYSRNCQRNSSRNLTWIERFQKNLASANVTSLSYDHHPSNTSIDLQSLPCQRVQKRVASKSDREVISQTIVVHCSSMFYEYSPLLTNINIHCFDMFDFKSDTLEPASSRSLAKSSSCPETIRNLHTICPIAFKWSPLRCLCPEIRGGSYFHGCLFQNKMGLISGFILFIFWCTCWCFVAFKTTTSGKSSMSTSESASTSVGSAVLLVWFWMPDPPETRAPHGKKSPNALCSWIIYCIWYYFMIYK